MATRYPIVLNGTALEELQTADALSGQFAVVSSTVVTPSALDLDLATANVFTKTINGNSGFTFSNAPASGTGFGFTLELTHTSGTVTWPTSVKWPGDTAPTLTAGKAHLFMFTTTNGGTTWRGAALANYAA